MVRQHLHLQAAQIGNDYQKAKEVIEGYIQASRVWTGTSATVPGPVPKDEPTEMDVDAVKANGKGKGQT